MPKFRGTGTALTTYTVAADDAAEAKEFIMDLVTDEFPDAEAYFVEDIERTED